MWPWCFPKLIVVVFAAQRRPDLEWRRPVSMERLAQFTSERLDCNDVV
jgi:hypothetical protein